MGPSQNLPFMQRREKTLVDIDYKASDASHMGNQEWYFDETLISLNCSIQHSYGTGLFDLVLSRVLTCLTELEMAVQATIRDIARL
jgi:hypothetical protein